MLRITQILIDHQLSGHILTENDLAHVLPGTDAARYALINKARKKNEIIRLKRGLYIINATFQTKPFSRHQIANAIVPESYVSTEAALAYYQWIPERVDLITSIMSHGNKKSFKNLIGHFEYRKIPIHPYEFFNGITRDTQGTHPVMIATPIRALLDLVYLHRIEWEGLEWLYGSLRIEPDYLKQISQTQLVLFRGVYKSKRVNQFLEELIKALKYDK